MMFYFEILLECYILFSSVNYLLNPNANISMIVMIDISF